MASLRGLNLTRSLSNKPKGRNVHLRSKILEGLDVQAKAIEAELKGEIFIRHAKRWVANPETGQKTLQSVPVRHQKWWWADDEGKVYFGLRYGNKWVEFKEGLNAIELKALAEIPKTIDVLKAAIQKGELDEALTKAANDRATKRRSLVRK